MPENTEYVLEEESQHDFSQMVEGLANLETNFLKFVFSLDKAYPLADGFEDARSEARSFIYTKRRTQEELFNLVSKYFNLGTDEREKISKLNRQGSNREVVSLLLNKKFDFEFENEVLLEYLKLENTPDLDFSQGNFKAICVASKSAQKLKYFVYSVESKDKTTDFNGLIPIFRDTYTYHLVLYDKETKTLEIRGGKRGYKKITGFLGKQGLKYQIDYEVAESQLNENFLLNFIKSTNFKIYGLEYGDSRETTVNIQSSKYDLDFLINSLLLLTDKVDLFNFKSLKFIYHDSRIKDVLGEIRINPNAKQGYYTIETLVKSSAKDKEAIDCKILDLYGIQIGKRYGLDNNYYLKKVFSSNSRAYWYARVKERPEFNKIIRILSEEKIITGSHDRIRLNTKKLCIFLNNLLKKITLFRLEDFAIEKVVADNNFLKTYGSYTEGSTNYKKLYQLKISFTDNTNNLLYFTNLDWYKIIAASLDLNSNGQELLRYFYKKVKFFNLLSKNLLDKKSLESYNFLIDRDKINSSSDPSIRGKIVENEVNNVLEGIFHNYISVGGEENPDGMLYLNKNLFILDSKSKEKVDSEDIDKLIRYMESDSFDKILEVKKKIGIFVFDRKLIRSLDAQTLKQRSSAKSLEVSCISMDLILRLYCFVKEHFDEIFLAPRFMEQLYSDFCELITKNSSLGSNSMDSIDSITRSEDEFLSQLKVRIQQHTFVSDSISLEKSKHE